VERRHIPVDELETFEEASACGTAAVCSPIGEIDDLDNGKKYIFSKNGEAGPITTQLYDRLRAIQNGDYEDIHGWNTILD
jgi:branched-chain amino acid aminotransferase